MKSRQRVLVIQNIALEDSKLARTDHGNRVRLDGVLGESLRRRGQVRTDINIFPSSVIGVAAVLEHGVDASLVFPALEDVPDGVTGAFQSRTPQG